MKDIRKSIGGLGNLMFKQAYILSQVMDNTVPDVYVQGISYWKKYREEIKLAFGEDIGSTINKVALHIRRGDYLQAHNFHQNLWETDYYQKAVAMFPNETFLVFCKDNQNPEQDKLDRVWCRENLPKLGITFEMAPYEDTEVEDLNLMASCKGIIMANSSFSWWAAFLGEQKKVVCPARWFTDGIQRTELLEEWIKI